MSKRQLKMVWDFRGPDAHKTALHHEIHLNEYVQLESVEHFGIGVETVSSTHSYAFMIISDKYMITVRDLLKPHRALLHKD